MTSPFGMAKKIDAYLSENGMDITVIDDSGVVGTSAAITHLDEVYMSSAATMVENVLKKRGPYKIRRLNILDHGNLKSFSLGDDWISDSSLSKFEPILSKLRPAFGASGFVHLQHCDIGINKGLLVKLAKMWDVSVYAGTGAHNPIYRVNFGDYVRADPNGSVRPAGRPDEETYQTYWGMRTGDYDGVKSSPEETSMHVTGVAHEDAPPPPLRPKLMRPARR